MNQQKTGQHYIQELRQQFPSAILDESWQTDTQATITIKTNMLPEVVEFLYYKQGGWLSVLFGNDEVHCAAAMRCTTCSPWKPAPNVGSP